MNELENVLIGMPEDIANLRLPDPTLRDFYRDENDRVFWVDEVSDDTLDVVKMIIRCNKEDKGIPIEDRKPITLMIDSPGGSVEVLYSVVKAIEISKTPVRTICYCNAFSAAADLLACGTTGYRMCMPGTNIMMHAGSTQLCGTVAQVDAAKKYFDNMGKEINKLVMSKTNIDTKIQKKMKDDYYMTCEDALNLGIIDKIITDLDEVF